MKSYKPEFQIRGQRVFVEGEPQSLYSGWDHCADDRTGALFQAQSFCRHHAAGGHPR